LNGALWFAKGSGHEPVYPPGDGDGYGQRLIDNIEHVKGASDPDDGKNDLAQIADRYDHVLVTAQPGDVVFFNGHVLHRSKQNYTTDRFRRSFVGHYCNARSYTQWGGEFATQAAHASVPTLANSHHILARGDTHLPFAGPRFGTACDALLPDAERSKRAQ